MAEASIAQNQKSCSSSHPWFCPETGIYQSKHPSVNLPTDPHLDLTTFVFSFKHRGASALVDSSSGSSIPYSTLHRMVKSFASGLHKMGISKGDVVLILLPNSIFFPVIVLGVVYLGAVFTSMNPLSSSSEIKKQVADTNACFAFTSVENLPKLEAIGVSAIGVPKSFHSSEMADSRAFSELLSGDFDSFPKPLIAQTDPAGILYSSGTTGLSKGVILKHGNFIAMVELFVRFEVSQYKNSPAEENVYLAVIPMFHIYGLSLFVIGILSLGSTVVVMRNFDVDMAVDAIDEFGVTHFPTVPPLLRAFLTKAKGRSLRSLKQISTGAAPVCRKIIDDLLQILPHVDFIQGYGLTESTAVGTRGFNTTGMKKFSSVGLLAPNMEARVVDRASVCSLPPDCRGELWLRGSSIMKGYLNNAEATKSTVNRDGWLHTGDIVYFDKDGYLYVIDRVKEMIKYKGFQIAPADLEAILITHPDITDAAVTGVMDEEAGEIPVAFVVRKNGSRICQVDVMDHVARQVAPQKKIRGVVFMQSIPKSPAGKILRRELKSNVISKI